MTGVRSFHTVAVPHRDVLEGRLTMDVFAADLWEVYKGRAPAEYKGPETFFRKTFITEGLRDLLDVVKGRCEGRGGDPVIQLQTPFGGGKTHALIALYHKSREWGAKTVVIVGTALQPGETIWGEIERQLTGSISKFKGMVPPGRESLRELLEAEQPLLILMDELLQYVTKAAGIRVEDSTLASQTITFVQELLEVPGTLDRVCVVITLPSSIIEHYDESAERMFQQLQKVSGRVEKVYTPVQDKEITKVIRQRLFSSIEKGAAKENVEAFMAYAESEGILPPGMDPTEYRDRFLDSYPFMPEVVDVLYNRWGSLTTFQRTRGVLRLLALVIHSLKDSNRPYISLADFDLENSDLRRELVKHIGNEFDSVISADITGASAGSKVIDRELGRTYQGLRLGTRSSTVVFLYSFSGGQEKGTYVGEIKRSATTLENPSSTVAEAVERLKGKLFYLQSHNEKYFFSNKPNMNRILLTKMENVKDQQVLELQRALLEGQIGKKMRTFLWPREPRDVPDGGDLKLVILDPELSNPEERMMGFLESKGEVPRVYRNTMFFLSVMDGERDPFEKAARRRIAYEMISKDSTLNLTTEDRREVLERLRKEDETLKGQIRMLYRIVYVPSRGGIKPIDLGIPTYGEQKTLDETVFEQLRIEGEISEKVSPNVITTKYLGDRNFVRTKQIYEAMLKTPGEERPSSSEAVAYGVREGVGQGLFGLGRVLEERPRCECFPGTSNATVAFDDDEAIIARGICNYQKMEGEGKVVIKEPHMVQGPEPGPPVVSPIKEVHLRFAVPRGKVSQIMGIMNFLQSRYNSIYLELRASEGTMTKEEYSDKIKEALRQLGVRIEDNK